MAKILLQVEVDSRGAITSLKQVEDQVKGFGSSNTAAAREVDQNEKALNRLLNRLEPTRTGTERLERNQKLLRDAFDSGKITGDRYAAAMGELHRRQGEAERSSGALSGAFGTVIKAAAGYITINAMKDAVMGSVAAFAEAERAQVRLEAVIRATSGAAGFNGEQLAKMATKYQNLTGVSDEVIKQGQAILLTFKSVRGDAFERTLAAALDLSEAFGQDLKSSMMQVAKAMEDPERGLTALRRVGVTFTAEQEKMIRAMHEAGRTADAQAMILDVLEKQVGGTAAAVGGTLSGAWRKFKETLNDAQEVQGQTVVQTFRLTDALNVLTRAMQWSTSQADRNKAASTAFFNAIKSGENVFRAFRDALSAGGDQAEKTTINVRRLGDVTATAQGTTAAADDTWRAVEKTLGDLVKSEEKAEKQQKALTDAQRQNIAVLDDQIKALREMIAEQEKERYYLDHILPLVEGSHATLTQYAADTSAVKDAFAGLNTELDEATGKIGGVWDVPPPPPEKVNQLATAFAGLFAKSFSEGFMSALEGEDFSKAWEGLWKGLAGMASTALGAMITDVLAGRGIGGEGSLLREIGLIGPDGKLNKGAAATLAGGVIWQYGAQRGNRAVGAIGGAMSGAGMGFQVGGWPGAIIGGIIGAVAGYYTSGQKQQKYYIQAGSSGRHAMVGAQGLEIEQEEQMEAELRQKFRGYRAGFRDILRLMGANMKDVDWGQFTYTLQGSNKDFSSLWSSVLSGLLPRAMLDFAKPVLQTGMEGMGISAGRAERELELLRTGQFDVAFAAFREWLTTIKDITSLQGLLGASTTELRDLVTRSERESFLTDFDDALERMGEMAPLLGDMFSDEQVRAAREVLAIGEQQYQAALEYFGRLESLRTGLTQAYADIRFGFAETRAREAGPAALGAFYQRQLDALMMRLTEASSPEELQSINQQIMSVAQRLWNLDLGEGNFAFRSWAETILNNAERISNELLDQWQEEVKARMEQERALLEQYREALIGTTGAQEALREVTDEEREARRRLREEIDRETEAITDAVAALAMLAAAAREAAGAIGSRTRAA